MTARNARDKVALQVLTVDDQTDSLNGASRELAERRDYDVRGGIEDVLGLDFYGLSVARDNRNRLHLFPTRPPPERAKGKAKLIIGSDREVVASRRHVRREIRAVQHETTSIHL